MRLRSRAGTYLMLVLSGQLLLLVVMSYLLLLSNSFAAEAERSRSILFESTRCGGQLADGARNLVAYTLSRSPQSEALYLKTLEQFSTGMNRLVSLTASVPADAEAMRYITYDGQQMIETLRAMKELIDEVPNPALLPRRHRNRLKALSSEGSPVIIERLRKELRELAHKHQKDTDNARARSTRQLLGLLIAAGAALNLLGCFVLIAAFTNVITKRLSSLRENTERMLTGAQLNPVVSGNDEITELDRFFHSMADIVKASTARNKLVLAGMPAGVLTLTEDARIQFANRGFASLSGYSDEELIGLHLSALLPGGRLDGKAIATLDDLENFMNKVVPSSLVCSAESRFVEFSFGTYDVEGNNTVVCSVLDVTARHEIENLKQEFVNIVSHDLRTPLTALLSVGRLLSTGRYGQLNGKGKEATALMLGECQRLIRLVTDLLTMSKLESGTFYLELAPVSVETILERAFLQVKSLADDKELSVEIDCAPAEIAGDEERLVEVLVVLLSNAIKYSAEGDTVRVSCALTNDFAVIRVRDYGCGIAPEVLPVIFERRSTRCNRTGQSTGLSLAVAKLVVVAHKGTLTASSTEGEGSEFRCELPLARAIESTVPVA